MNSFKLKLVPHFFKRAAMLLAIALCGGTATLAQNGMMDPSFGLDGWLVSPFSKYNIGPRAVVVQSDGKIVVAGSMAMSTERSSICLMRFLSNGEVDTTFGKSGLSISLIDSFENIASCVIADNKGNLYVGGFTKEGLEADWVVARYTSTGKLDQSFGTNGALRGDLEGYNYLVDFEWASDGSLICIGSSNHQGNNDMMVLKCKPSGVFDNAFGTKGYLFVDFNADNDYASDVKIDEDGNIIIGGITWVDETNFDFAFLSLNASGQLNRDFSGDGMHTLPVLYGNDMLRGIDLLSDGSILAVGGAYNETKSQDIAVIRLTASGELDVNFGNEGIVLTDIDEGYDAGDDIVVFDDGSMVVSGYTWGDVAGDFLLLGYHDDGTIDEDFGKDGLLFVDYEGSDNAPQQMVLGPHNEMYVLGSFYSGQVSVPLVCRIITGHELSIEGIFSQHGSFQVYPNPATSALNVELTAQEDEVTLYLTDLQGRVVTTPRAFNISAAQPLVQLDLPLTLEPGYYQLVVVGQQVRGAAAVVVR